MTWRKLYPVGFTPRVRKGLCVSAIMPERIAGTLCQGPRFRLDPEMIEAYARQSESEIGGGTGPASS